MIHLLQVNDPESSHIKFTITKKNKCNLSISTVDDSLNVNLSLDELHEFIGTLLHVQQKLKNR